jgi:hypothetical protein
MSGKDSKIPTVLHQLPCGMTNLESLADSIYTDIIESPQFIQVFSF